MFLDVRRLLMAVDDGGSSAGLLAVSALFGFTSVDACELYGEGTSEHDHPVLCQLLSFMEYWMLDAFFCYRHYLDLLGSVIDRGSGAVEEGQCRCLQICVP